MQHLLHAGATGGAFVADDDDIASLDLAAQDDGDGFFLRLHHAGRAAELPQFFLDTRCLNDGAIRSEVAAQDHEATVGGVSVLCIMDAAIGLVGIQRLPAVGLGERFGGAHATRCGVEELAGLVQSLVVTDVPVVQPLFSVVVERGVHLQAEVASATQLTKDGGDAAGTVDVLDVVGAVGRHL